MDYRARLRRLLKWTCTVFCALAALPWLASAKWSLQLLTPLGNGVTFVNGGLILSWASPYEPFRLTWCGGVSIRKTPPRPFEWNCLPMRSARGVEVPGWYPLAALALPTAAFWWLGRRRRVPGHCRNCGYDLTGNVSGRCSECGTAIRDDHKVS